jgi:hypothetical protein
MKINSNLSDDESLRHFIFYQASDEIIANRTPYSYDDWDIEKIRLIAIQILLREGDVKYSTSALSNLIEKAVAEYQENMYHLESNQNDIKFTIELLWELMKDAAFRIEYKGKDKYIAYLQDDATVEELEDIFKQTKEQYVGGVFIPMPLELLGISSDLNKYGKNAVLIKAY